MASNFSSTSENTCQGANCKAITDVTYYGKEKKRLCKDCADKEGCIIEARKGLSSLYCNKHPDRDVEVYCKKHDMALCCICAVTDHKPCKLRDISDAVEEIKAKLNTLKGKAKDKLKSCQVYGDHISQCRKDSDSHLQAVKGEVDLTIQEAMKTDQEREDEDTAKINQEIDDKNGKLQEKIQKLQEEIRRMNDEIRENNEEREKRHERNHTNAEKRREPMNIKQRSLHTDIQIIAQEIEKKIGELEKSWKDVTKNTEDAIQILDTVLKDDRNVVKSGHLANKSVSAELKKPLDEGRVTHITQTVSGVSFVKGVGREKYNGRIDYGEWKLNDRINVRDKITVPRIVGCIDESNVIITDLVQSAHHTYMLDMNTERRNRPTQKVITGSDTSCVTSCAWLNDDKIVCGKYRKDCKGDRLTGCISVYDRQWKLIRDVTIPRNTTYDFTRVDVAADQDGMIIAAEGFQSKIYVINPADGKIINTITYKENIVMFDVLSSGHIIARPSPPDHRVFIIDREGNESREIIHSNVILNVCIDPMTDDLYVVTDDDEYKTCVIDQVMSRGDMMKRRVASFPLSTRLSNRTHLNLSRMMMTSSGKMIACDGDDILVFKKILTLKPVWTGFSSSRSCSIM